MTGHATSIATLSPEWHELRRTRICATDWPKILLLPEQWSGTPFGSPLSVWEKLTGKRVEEARDDLHLRWGQYNEAMHAEWLRDDAGVEVQRCNVSWVSGDRYEASPDGFCGTVNKHSEIDDAVVELKAPTPWSAPWEDSAPLEYKVQTQATMWVTGRSLSIVSSLVFPGPPRYEWMEADTKNVARWLDQLNDWWERYVVHDTPPPATGSDRDRKILDRMRPEDGKLVVMPPEMVDLCAEINEVEARMKGPQGRVDTLRNQLRQWMNEQGASRVVDPERTIAWSFTKSGLRRVKA